MQVSLSSCLQPGQLQSIQEGVNLTPSAFESSAEQKGELLSSDSERTADFDTPARASSTSSTGSRGKPRQLRYGAAANRGPRRTMEDAHIAVSPFWDADLQQAAKPGAQATLDEPCQGFFAVFDGHGGVAAAQFASKHIVSFVTSDRGFPEDLGAALRQAFLQTDQHLREACEGDVSASGRLAEESGTTALAAVIWNQQITVANAGDSRAVLCRHGKAIDLSVDHKPDAPGEAERIAAAGGYVCPEGMLNGQLGVSRAFGNHTFTDLKQPADSDGTQLGPLTAEPDVTVHDILAEDEFMLLACDGLWDVLPSQRAIEFARQRLREHNDPQQCAQKLVEEALRLHTADNISVITICFGDEAPPRRTFGGRPHGMPGRSLSQQGLGTLSTALSNALE